MSNIDIEKLLRLLNKYGVSVNYNDNSAVSEFLQSRENDFSDTAVVQATRPRSLKLPPIQNHMQIGNIPISATPPNLSLVDNSEGIAPPEEKPNNFLKFMNGKYGDAISAGMELAGSALAGGRESKVGNVINTLGDVANLVPVVGKPLKGLFKGVSGAFNLLFGSKINQQAVSNYKSHISNIAGFTSNVGDNDALAANVSSMPKTINIRTKDIGKDGLFNSAATNLANTLNNDQRFAAQRAIAALENNQLSIEKNTLNDLKAHSAAYGGPLQSYGTDWTNNITIIGEGGTHEENPNGGVMVGADQQGIPNLFEQDEVIWRNNLIGDYSYSNRLKTNRVPKEVRNKYKLRVTKNSTFADEAKKIQKETEETPYDPIAQRTVEDNLLKLAFLQEQVRAQQEAKEKEQQQYDSEVAALEYAMGGSLFTKKGNLTKTAKEFMANYYDKAGPIKSPFGDALDDSRDWWKENDYTELYKNFFTPNSWLENWYKKNPYNNLSWEEFTNKANDKIRGAAHQYVVDAYYSNFGPTGHPYKDRRFRNYTDKWTNAVDNLDIDKLNNFLNSQKDNYIADLVKNNNFKGWDKQKWVDNLKDYIWGNATNVFTNYLSSLNSLPLDGNPSSSAVDYSKLGPVKWKPFTNPFNDILISTLNNRDTYANDHPYDFYNKLTPEENALYNTLRESGPYDITKDPWGLENVRVEGNRDFETEALLEEERNRQAKNKGMSAADWLRLSPIALSAKQVLDDALGNTNREDYSNAEAIERSVANIPDVRYTPAHDYYTFKPFDLQRGLNSLNDNTSSTARSLLDLSGGNRATAAAQLANINNLHGNKVGELLAQMQDFNEKGRQAEQAINQKTNLANAEQSLKAQMASRDRYKLRMQAAAQAAELRAKEAKEVGEARSANKVQLANNLGNLGADMLNREDVRWLADKGVFGALGDDTISWLKDYLNERGKETASNEKAFGGPIPIYNERLRKKLKI